MTDTTSRGYHILYDPPPIPDRRWDWRFWHDDYDGAEDAHDHRAGYAPSLSEAKREIDELVHGDMDPPDPPETHSCPKCGVGLQERQRGPFGHKCEAQD